MLTSLSIRKKLFGSFAVIVFIIAALLAVVYGSFTRLASANAADRHTLEVIQAISQLQNDILELQVESRGYYLTGNAERLARSRKEMHDLPLSIARLRELTGDNAAQVARFQELGSAIEHWSSEVIESQLKLRESLGTAPGAADTMGRTAPLVSPQTASKRIFKLIGEAAAEERHLLEHRAKAASGMQETTQLVLVFGGIVTIVLGLVVAGLLARAILRPLGELTRAVGEFGQARRGARAVVMSGDALGRVSTEFNRMAQSIEDAIANEQAARSHLQSQVDVLLDPVSLAARGNLTGTVNITGSDAIGQLAEGIRHMLGNLRELVVGVQSAGILVRSSATEIAASARQQEATGVEQAQTSVEVMSTTKEISTNTSQLLKTMEDASSVADFTGKATQSAQQDLTRIDSMMQQMVEATDAISAKLASLSERATNINSLVATITKVADQTNLLSLNAGIEAEKAGEAGRGFQVVATEIRRLSDQTALSTWDIEQMLKEMQSSVSASVMGMEKFSQDMRASVGEVRQVTQQLSDVMQQTQQLAPQFDVVLQGMQSQSTGADQIANTMRQLSEASQQSAAALKSTSEAVQLLEQAAGGLQSSVARFTVE